MPFPKGCPKCFAIRNKCHGGKTWTPKLVREHLIAFGCDPTLQNVRPRLVRVLHLFFNILLDYTLPLGNTCTIMAMVYDIVTLYGIYDSTHAMGIIFHCSKAYYD